MNQLIAITHQYSQIEYLAFILTYFGSVSIFFILTLVLPSKYTLKEVMLSMTSIAVYAIFFLTQLILQNFFGNSFSFSYSLLALSLLPLYILTMLYGMNEKSWGRITVLAVSVLVTLVPLVYTGFIPMYPAITFVTSYLLSTLLLIIFLRRYHA